MKMEEVLRGRGTEMDSWRVDDPIDYHELRRRLRTLLDEVGVLSRFRETENCMWEDVDGMCIYYTKQGRLSLYRVLLERRTEVLEKEEMIEERLRLVQNDVNFRQALIQKQDTLPTGQLESRESSMSCDAENQSYYSNLVNSEFIREREGRALMSKQIASRIRSTEQYYTTIQQGNNYQDDDFSEYFWDEEYNSDEY